MEMEASMVKVEDFTNKELINAIVEWMRDDSNAEAHTCNLADELASGEWLNYCNEKLKGE